TSISIAATPGTSASTYARPVKPYLVPDPYSQFPVDYELTSLGDAFGDQEGGQS
ncbi:unnamed protein product, partial [Amoebophrya sp. A25]